MDREAFIASELEKYRSAWVAGNYLGLANAVVFCLQNGLPLPQWTHESVLTALDLQATTSGGKRGRTANPISRAKQDHIHATRWSTVNFWYNHPEFMALFGRKRTRDAAFQIASEKLREAMSEAGASPETIKESFDLVEAAVRAGTGARFGVGNSED